MEMKYRQIGAMKIFCSSQRDWTGNKVQVALVLKPQ
jgi:hypothetical protein